MKWSNRLFNWFARYIHLQLFITIVSMPVLIYWGLPISVMTFISNLVFTPFLMIFLLIASLIFFAELLCIPNQWLIKILEITTSFWEKILGYGSNSWLIGFTKPSIVIFLGIVIGAFSILHIKKLRSKIHNILGLTFLFIITCCYLKFFTSKPTGPFALECNSGSIAVLYSNKQIIVIDPGVIGQRFSTASWLEYTLLSELNKRFGTSTIDYLIIMQPGKLVLEHIEYFCHCTHIKKIYLVFWQGEADKKLLHIYGRLRTTLKTTGTLLQRIGYKEEFIFLSATDYISIKSLPTLLSYQAISFNALHITGTIATQSINIYSKKYKNIDKQNPTI